MKKLVIGLVIGLVCFGMVLSIGSKAKPNWEETIPGTLNFEEVTAPDTPLAGYTKLYFYDGRLRYKDDAGTDVTPIRTATLVVAASNSSAKSIAQADYQCDGTDDQVQIQAAIDALPVDGGKIALMEGTFIKGNISPITIPSNVEIMMTPGTIITFKSDVGDGAGIFANADVGGNTAICVVGGVLDGNKDNQAIGEQYGIKLTKVRQSKVDCWIKNFRGRNIWEVSPVWANDFTNREYPNSKEVEFDVIDKLLRHPLLETFDDLQSDWSLPEGVSHDTETRLFGASSIKIIAPSSGIRFSQKAGNWNLEGYDLIVFFKVSDKGDANSVTLHLITDGSHFQYYQLLFERGEFEDLTDGWRFRVIHISSSGSLDPSDITILKFTVTSLEGETPTVWFGGMKMIPAVTAEKGFVLFRFDDGRTDALIKAKPILDRYNYSGNVFVPTSWVGSAGTLSWEQLGVLQESGWDVGSHSVTHPDLTTLSEAEIENEIRISQDSLISHGFYKGSRFFSHPYANPINEEILSIVEKYYYFGLGKPIPQTGFPFPFSHWKYLTHTNTAGKSLEEIEDLIDTVSAKKQGIVLLFHAIDEDLLSGIVDYIHSKKIPVLTSSDILDRYLFKKPEQHKEVNIFQDCVALSTTYVHAAITGTGAEQEITTAITNPDVPRNISITNSANSTGDVTIEGIDAKGNSVSEAITIVTGGNAYGDVAFSTVSKITIPATVVNPDTIEVGISDKLGLSNVVYATGDVYKVKVNNADATGQFSMAADVDVTNDTLDMSSLVAGAIGAGDDVTIWFRSNLNILN